MLQQPFRLMLDFLNAKVLTELPLGILLPCEGHMSLPLPQRRCRVQVSVTEAEHRQLADRRTVITTS